MNKEALEEVINYTEVCRIIRDTDLLKYKDREKLQLYLMNFRDNYKDLKQKLHNILTYAKKQCDDYLKEDDCEYCDGVFASCRKVLQLAGEDISEYK